MDIKYFNTENEFAHHSHPAHWNRTKIMSVSPQGQDQHRCKSVSLLCSVSSEQPPAVCPFSHFSGDLQETSEDPSLTWPFTHRHRHARWPVDVTELFPRFCCWTLLRLSCRWACLCRGYWHYRNLIDDWLTSRTQCLPAGLYLVGGLISEVLEVLLSDVCCHLLNRSFTSVL